MFKNIIRELGELGRGGTISIPIQADVRGYIDKQCPSKDCLFTFKVMKTDWREKFREEGVFCPRCGHEAPADSWFTAEQIRHARKQGVAAIRSRISRALTEDAREFNAAQPRSGFLRISMEVSCGGSRHMIVPLAAADVLEQALACKQCGARYSILGTAFFCPCCGTNSVEQMFDAALDKVRTKVEGIEIVRQALRASFDADRAEVVCRSTIEGGLQDCVVAFQHLAERIYVPPPGAKAPSQNAFQRLDEGSQLWKAAVAQGYDDWLTRSELADLALLFQRRHLLAHRDGIVDAKYVEKSGDRTYRIGQRIVVTIADVLKMVALVEKLGTAMRGAVLPTQPARP